MKVSLKTKFQLTVIEVRRKEKTQKETNSCIWLTDSTFVFSNIHRYIIPVIKLMWLVKFCFSNLSRERVDSEKFHDQTLRWSNLNQNQHFLPFCQKLDLEGKEEPWLFLQQNPLCFSDGCFYSNSKMSALLLINGRRYDFGVNHGNVFQILRHFWLAKSVLFFILHQSEQRIEYGISPANCICLWFLFVAERLDFPRYKICDRWFSFTTLTPGLASK